MQSAKKGSSKWRAALAANEVRARVSVCVLTYGYGSGRVQRTPARSSRQQPSLSIWAPLVKASIPFFRERTWCCCCVFSRQCDPLRQIVLNDWFAVTVILWRYLQKKEVFLTSLLLSRHECLVMNTPTWIVTARSMSSGNVKLAQIEMMMIR